MSEIHSLSGSESTDSFTDTYHTTLPLSLSGFRDQSYFSELSSSQVEVQSKKYFLDGLGASTEISCPPTGPDSSIIGGLNFKQSANIEQTENEAVLTNISRSTPSPQHEAKKFNVFKRCPTLTTRNADPSKLATGIAKLKNSYAKPSAPSPLPRSIIDVRQKLHEKKNTTGTNTLQGLPASVIPQSTHNHICDYRYNQDIILDKTTEVQTDHQDILTSTILPSRVYNIPNTICVLLIGLLVPVILLMIAGGAYSGVPDRILANIVIKREHRRALSYDQLIRKTLRSFRIIALSVFLLELLSLGTLITVCFSLYSSSHIY